MQKDLIYIPTNNMSRDEWLAYRMSGIGASEVPTVMGLNPYKSPTQMFYEKVGTIPVNTIENIAMFVGKHSEAMIADFWQYWDGDEQSLITNFNAGKIIRKCSRVNAYVRNPECPHLFVSLDRRIHKVDGLGEGALECKNMSYMVGKMWEGGIPPYHIIQIHTQMGVCRFTWGELAVMQDGRNFMAYPFEFKKQLFQNIVQQSREFWGRVEKSRKVLAKIVHARGTMNYRLVEELGAEIESHEPPPDGSAAYRSFMNASFLENGKAGEKIGTPEQLATAEAHKKNKAAIKKLEDKGRLMENELIKSMQGFDKLTFGASGYVSFRKDKNGSMTFKNALK